MAVPLPEKNQTAVVTGGARGFGVHVVRALHAAGFRVVITDVDPGPAAELATGLDLAGETAVTATLDIRKPGDFKTVLDKVVTQWGSCEVLVNNAAKTAAQDLFDIEPAFFNEVLTTNAGGCFTGCQVFGGYFKEQGYGRLINMASLAGQNGGTATGAHYAASKGAIMTITKVFARDLAAYGVTCNAVAPGPMDTPAVHAVLGDRVEDMIGRIPVRQLGDPGFVARMIALLASPAAGFVNGACWDANGGLLMR